MCGSVFIETPRLIVKTMDAKDYSALRLQQKDPIVMKFFGGPRDDARINFTLKLLSDHLEQYGFSQGPVFLKETREFIGRAGLVHLDFKPVLDVELGVFLLSQYSGKGYATELCEAFTKHAFEVLKLPRVFATVDPNNLASCCICEKLGMQFEKEDVYSTLNKTVRYYVKTI